MSCGLFYLTCLTRLFNDHKQRDMTGPTSVCEGLDVVRQVNVHALRILHFLEDDPNEPHGYKVVPVTEAHENLKKKKRVNSRLFYADFRL